MTDAIQTDSPTAVAFLSRWRPEGPWVLTAIDPDRKSIETRTFHVRQAEDMRRWIERNNNVRNLYFHVNPTTRDLSKKAEREDIAALAWLHVDIDPRVSENIESERERALALLTSKLPAGVPAPTAIVFSGGGYQGFWKLGEPLAIDGDLARAEDAKRYNLQLELLFGADNCHNVDRIMRLPGTINLPDARKKRKGRQPALATLVSFDEKLVYPLSTFTPAPLVQGAESFSSPGKVNVSGNVSRLGSVDELPERVPDWCKVLIVQGTDPDNPTKYPSRSEALFTVCCELVRAGCDDQTIYTVITDPDFKISSSVIDKGSNAEKYAKRQIERAKEEAAANGGDPVAFVNRSYFAALEGGKVRYYREDRGRASLVMMNSEAFAFELAPHTAPVQSERATKNVPVSKLWATSTRRRYYRRGFVLDPTGGNTDDEYNLWRGFGIDAQAGDWSRMREHIAEVLAGGNSTYADYITRWAAWAVQNPATPPRVALVFRGDEGVGKGAFANALVQIFGEHGLRVQSMQHLTGKFNAHLRHCCMLFADEAVAPGDADAVGALTLVDAVLVEEANASLVELEARLTRARALSARLDALRRTLANRRAFRLVEKVPSTPCLDVSPNSDDLKTARAYWDRAAALAFEDPYATFED